MESELEMSVPRIEPGADPTRVVLWAALRVAGEFDLPDQESVASLLATNVVDPELKVVSLASRYAERAAKELVTLNPGYSAPLIQDWHPVATALARRAVRAARIAWPIFEHAQDGRTTAPDSDAWDLLVMMVTLVYVQLEEHHDVSRLITVVTDLAGEIEDATSEDA